MSLGDLFPDHLKKEFADRNIDLGNTLLIKVEDFKLNYDKYLVIVGLDNQNIEAACVVINSDINQNIAPTTYLQNLHLLVELIKHPFLQRDSYLNCSELKEYPKQDLINFLIANPERLVGNIDIDLLTNAYKTIKRASTIPQYLKNKYGFI